MAQAYETHLKPGTISSYRSVQKCVFEFLNKFKITLPLNANQAGLLAAYMVENRDIQGPTMGNYMSAVHSLHIDKERRDYRKKPGNS